MAQIIQTCSKTLLIAALIAPQTAFAKRPADAPRSALGHFVTGRVAEIEGRDSQSLAAYGAALAAEPGNQLLALRTMREALRQGNYPLALRASRSLTADLPTDAILLQLAERIKANDWRGANSLVAQFETQENLAFLAPLFKSWIAFGSRTGDPIAILNSVSRESYASNYVGEMRAYIMLAKGQFDDGYAIARAQAAGFGGLKSLRLSAASSFLKAGKKDRALTLLALGGQDFADARQAVDAGKPLPLPIATAQRGMAQIFHRLTDDLLREKAPSLAITMARIGRLLDPAEPFLALSEADALTAIGRDALAERALLTLSADPIVARAAETQRIKALEGVGRLDEAISLAATAVAKRPDSTFAHGRYGDLLLKRERYAEAAKAYGQAIACYEKGDKAVELWLLLYLQGTAHDRAGDWPAAKQVLAKSIANAPNQAGPHNYLGYAMLERRENLPEALALIRKAHAIAPNDIAITDSLGWALVLTGGVEEGIELLESAAKAAPADPEIGEHLGDAYWKAGRKVDARYAWSAALLFAKEASANRLQQKIDFGLTQQTAAR